MERPAVKSIPETAGKGPAIAASPRTVTHCMCRLRSWAVGGGGKILPSYCRGRGPRTGRGSSPAHHSDGRPTHDYCISPQSSATGDSEAPGVSYITVLVLCGCGGIGRHARLRIWCRKACGFESLHPHRIEHRSLQPPAPMPASLLWSRCVRGRAMCCEPPRPPRPRTIRDENRTAEGDGCIRPEARMMSWL